MSLQVVGSYLFAMLGAPLVLWAMHSFALGFAGLGIELLGSSTNENPGIRVPSIMTSELAIHLPQIARIATRAFDLQRTRKQIYTENRNHIYTLAFYATGSELAAESLSTNAFCRAFTFLAAPSPETLDRALIGELCDHLAEMQSTGKQTAPLGTLTLDCDAMNHSGTLRAKRAELEQAVLSMPVTERLIYLLRDGEGYSEQRVGTLLGLRFDEVRFGLHQARLRLRELLAK